MGSIGDESLLSLRSRGQQSVVVLAAQASISPLEQELDKDLPPSDKDYCADNW